MKKISALILVLAMALTLAACSSGPDKQPAIDAFNAASTAFSEVATGLNAIIDQVPEDMVETMTGLAETLEEHKALLEGDEIELTEEQLAEMTAWYNDVETLMGEIKAEYGL